MGRWLIIGFSLIDWALVLVLVVVVVIGFRRGFWVTMGTVIGAIAGVFGGLFLMPVIVELVPAGVIRIITMVAVTGLLIWLGMWFGRKICGRLRLQISTPFMLTVMQYLGANCNCHVDELLISTIA